MRTAWDLSQVYDALDRLPHRGWNHFRHNLNFMFEAKPQSYKEKVWGYMFGKHLFSEGNYIDYLKTSQAHRALLTWKGVVKVPDQDVASFLEDV